MKKFTTLGLMLSMLLLFSCGMAKFDRLPGAELMEIPSVFHGEYTITQPNTKMFAGEDTITLNINPTNIIIKSKSGEMVKSIKQDFQISMLEKEYVLGISDPSIPSLWNIILLEPTKNGFKAYPLIDNSLIENAGGLSANFTSNFLNLDHPPIVPQAPPVMAGNGAVTAPSVNPKAGFPSQTKYFNMNEDQLLIYYNNSLKANSFIPFNKPVANANKAGSGNKKTKK